jgi:N-methylhydantoinase B
MNNISIGDTDNSFAYYETIGSGSGAGRGCNGEDAIQTHMTNTLSTPVEVIENELPIRITNYSIRRKKVNKSAYKGGSGIKRTYNFRKDVVATLITERRVIEPYGLRSGSAGQLGRNFLIKRDGKKIDLPSKVTIECKKGESIEINSPGGGSWGLEKK